MGQQALNRESDRALKILKASRWGFYRYQETFRQLGVEPEDAIQEIAEKLLAQQTPDQWLWRSARFRAINIIRRRYFELRRNNTAIAVSKQKWISPEDSGEEDSDPFFFDRNLDRLIEVLSIGRKKGGDRAQKQIDTEIKIILLAISGHNNAEIGEILSISADTVKKIRHRLCQRLRELLPEEDFGQLYKTFNRGKKQ